LLEDADASQLLRHSW